jgi:hypothetical protein
MNLIKSGLTDPESYKLNYFVSACEKSQLYFYLSDKEPDSKVQNL